MSKNVKKMRAGNPTKKNIVIWKNVGQIIACSLVVLLLCGEIKSYELMRVNPQSLSHLVFAKKLKVGTLRRIKSPNMDMVFMTPTPLGAVTLTHDRFAEHIAGRHIVTIENIRTTLFYPEKVYRSRNRWCFEKGDVRVVVTQEGLVTTAYYMDGR